MTIVAIVIDIETVAGEIPDWYREEVEADVRARYVKEDIIEKHRSKGLRDWGFEPDGAKVVAIGFTPIEVGYTLTHRRPEIIMHPHTETVMVNAKHSLQEFANVPWITYNGSSFDMPVLASTALQYSIDIQIPLRRPNHIDLFLSDVFKQSRPSLRRACQQYRVAPPTTSGASVQGWFDNEQYDKISAHCFEDVEATAKLYLNLCKAFGKKAIDGTY